MLSANGMQSVKRWRCCVTQSIMMASSSGPTEVCTIQQSKSSEAPMLYSVSKAEK
ncbi:hypothetical protein J6590_063982 [Homalodisca vitripennis]|nr:hypothetical protein J6590_063982 [Homalodisca vitripennis]